MLLWLIFLPITGGFIGWLSHLFSPHLATSVRSRNIFKKLPAWIAMLSIFIALVIAILLWHDAITTLEQDENWSKSVNFQWIPLLGIHFHLVLDSLSILLITTSLLVVILTLLYSYKESIHRTALFYFCLLMMTSSVMMLFVVTDLFLLFLCWEAIAIPFYFLISLWGRRDSSTQLRFSGVSKFLIYTQISGLFMLISIVSLALINWNLTDIWTFDSQVLTKTPISSDVEFFLMLGFLIAFMVRIPLVPFHNWFIEAHIEASTAGSMMTSGLLVSTGIYGLLRFALPMFPNAFQMIVPVMLTISFLTVLYSALVAFNQSDIKKLIAYVNIAIMGFLTAVIYSGSILAYQGVIIQTIAMNLSMVGLFVISGLLVEAYLTRNINQFIGLRAQINHLSTFTLFFMLAVVGIPGTANFVGNFMMLLGIYGVFSYYTILLIIGLVLISVAFVVRLHPIFYGSLEQTTISKQTLAKKDILLLLTLIAILFFIGLYPKMILDMSYPFIYQTVQHMNAAHIGGN